jgi:hypothetical protein
MYYKIVQIKYTNLMYKRNIQKIVQMKCTLHLFIFCVIFLGLPYMYKTKSYKKPLIYLIGFLDNFVLYI